jgi:hypothetical protein
VRAALGIPRRSLDPVKTGVLDLAHRRFGLRSGADLGAVWGVDGGYAIHLAAKRGVDRVVVVDDHFSPAASTAIARRPNMRTVSGNFGDAGVAAEVGDVDALVMFDVLLHQVKPDWDEILALYAPRTSCFILAGPWYRATDTIRLLDLGEHRYLSTVIEQDINHGLFDRLDELNEQRGRPWRDVHDVWQWGITDRDLRAHLATLGFELAHYENHGPWRSLEAFTSAAYVFARPELIEQTS